MIVLLAVAGEGNGYLRINTGAALALEVTAGIKSEPVIASWCIGREIAAAAIGVGRACRNFNPAARCIVHALHWFAMQNLDVRHFEPAPAI